MMRPPETWHAPLYSRRTVCLMAGGALASLAFTGLAGCSQQSTDSSSQKGYASDTEIKDYPLTIKIFADSNLLRTNNPDGSPRLEAYIPKYQSEMARGDVSIGVKYLDSAALAAAMTNGLPEKCDGVVCLEDTIGAGVSSGILYGGGGGTSVRKFSAVLNESLVVVRKKGGSAQMPDAKTFNGEDSPDGTYNRLQQLGSFEGKIAVPPTSVVEGVMTNAILAQYGLYSDESGVGGEYDSSLEGKIVICDTIDAALSALASGSADIGFVAKSTLWGSTSSIESIYEPTRTRRSYAGASLTDADEGGVVRDFFEYVSRMV